MKQLGWTTISQSKKLVEAGLEPNTADMVVVKDNTYCNALSAFNGATLCQNYNEIKNKTNYIPCWSLGALLELMPNYQFTHDREDLYSIYMLLPKEGLKKFKGFKLSIEAIVEVILWLLENGYLNNYNNDTKRESNN